MPYRINPSRVFPVWGKKAAGKSTIREGVSRATANTGSVIFIGGGENKRGSTHWPILLQPGTHTLRKLSHRWGNFGTDRVDNLAFEIWERNGDTGTRLLKVDLQSDVPVGTTTHYLDVDLTTGAYAALNRTITIESGKSYYYAFQLSQKTTATPGIYAVDANVIDVDSLRFNAADDTEITTVDYSNPSATESGEFPCGYIEWETASRQVAVISSPSAAGYALPRFYDEDYHIVFRDLVMTDGNALTVDLCDINTSDGTKNTIMTLVVDMGATDQVVFNGNSVPLNDTVSEAGDTFDVSINVRPSSSHIDVFWVNKTTGQGAQSTLTGKYRDIQTISHAAKYTGSRGTEYTASIPKYLDISGTFTCSQIEVSAELEIMVGDSQVVGKTTETSAAALQRLGSAISGAMDFKRSTWLAGQSGCRAVSVVTLYCTAMDQQWKNNTPGKGDLCAMTGVVPVLCGPGTNDIAQIGNDRVKAATFLSDYENFVDMVLSDAGARGDRVLVVGIPPAATSGTTALESRLYLAANHILAKKAYEYGQTFYDTWPVVWDGTIIEGVYQPLNTYISGDNVHYSTEGAEAIAALAVAAYETDTFSEPTDQP